MNDTRKFRWMVLPIALASLFGVPAKIGALTAANALRPAN